MDTHRCAALAVLVSCSTGCAAGVSLIAAPSVDTTGHFGGEGRVQAIAAAGNEHLRFFVSMAGGAGGLDQLGTGYGLVSPEVGAEGGREIRWSAGGLYTPRFLFQGPVGVVHGAGVAGHVLFRVRRLGGEDGSLLIGPRLSLESVFGDLAVSETSNGFGLFQLALVVRAITFDTTAKSWTR